MADYNQIKKFILSWEGGYVNNKLDKGGATNKGVTWATWSAYAKKKGFIPTLANLRAITDAQWDEIFRPNYWNVWKAANINNQSIATLLVDWGYCSGTTTVIKNLQRYLGVKADGIMGPVTLNKLNHNEKSPIVVFEDLRDRRKKFLNDIVKRNPPQKTFLNGWLNRLNHIGYENIKLNK